MKSSTFTTKDGAKISYRIHGENHKTTPFVMFNGMSAVMEDWSPLVEELGKSRTVLIFDHRGIGSSSVPSDWDHSLSLESMALDVIALVTSLGWKQIDALGFSMGGHILQTLLCLDEAIDSPNGVGRVVRGVQIRRVVLAATMTKMPHGDFDPSEMEKIASQNSNRKVRNQKLTEYMMSMQFDPSWISESSSNAKELARRVQIALSTNRPQSVIGQQTLAISEVDTRKVLNRIGKGTEVLIVHGEKDRMVAYKESEYTSKLIPHAFRTDYLNKQYGHFWYVYGTPQGWAKVLNEFLDGGKAKL